MTYSARFLHRFRLSSDLSGRGAARHLSRMVCMCATHTCMSECAVCRFSHCRFCRAAHLAEYVYWTWKRIRARSRSHKKPINLLKCANDHYRRIGIVRVCVHIIYLCLSHWVPLACNEMTTHEPMELIRFFGAFFVLLLVFHYRRIVAVIFLWPVKLNAVCRLRSGGGSDILVTGKIGCRLSVERRRRRLVRLTYEHLTVCAWLRLSVFDVFSETCTPNVNR